LRFKLYRQMECVPRNRYYMFFKNGRCEASLWNPFVTGEKLWLDRGSNPESFADLST